MHDLFPFLSVGGVSEPRVGLVDEGEIVGDRLAPVVEVATLRTVATQTGEERLLREARSVSVIVRTSLFANRFAGDFSVSGEADAEDVAEAAGLRRRRWRTSGTHLSEPNSSVGSTMHLKTHTHTQTHVALEEKTSRSNQSSEKYLIKQNFLDPAGDTFKHASRKSFTK